MDISKDGTLILRRRPDKEVIEYFERKLIEEAYLLYATRHKVDVAELTTIEKTTALSFCTIELKVRRNGHAG